MKSQKNQKSAQELHLETVKRLKSLSDRLDLEDRMTRLRSDLEQQKDVAHLVLASELLSLYSRYQLCWYELPSALGLSFDYSLLFRLAKRQTYTSKAVHAEICNAINRYRTANGEEPVDFPTWITWQELA